jgi:hypothetical protein
MTPINIMLCVTGVRTQNDSRFFMSVCLLCDDIRFFHL